MGKLYLAGVCVWLCLIGAGCGKEESRSSPESTAAAPPATSIHLDRVVPSSTSEAKIFNPRPDGQAAIAVFGTGIPSGATISWNDQPLASAGGGTQGWVSAVIPANLYQSAGSAKVTVRGGDQVSNALDFTIYGKTGPAPNITALGPTSAVAGKGFNVQPGGESALGIAGTDFLPGVSVVVDGKKMSTVFGRDTLVSAVIPPSIVAHAGSHEVWTTNPDGKSSNKVTFKISE